jgi:hypothetical protein
MTAESLVRDRKRFIHAIPTSEEVPKDTALVASAVSD